LENTFAWIYKNLTEEDLKYIVLDSSSLSHLPEKLMVRTCITLNQHGKIKPIFFFPKDGNKNS
jgi:hypothetical protein